MKFFKYLVFIFSLLFSINSFAYNPQLQYLWKSSASSKLYEAIEPSCDYLKQVNNGAGIPGYSYSHYQLNASGTRADCYYNSSNWSYSLQVPNPDYDPKSLQCPDPGYPMYVYFDAGGKIPQQRCQPLGDKFCVFKAKPDSIVLNHANNRQSTVLYNVSKTPVSSCTPLDAGQCDKNDPYGDCYQPPNDGCTRLADGSITCPDGAAPPSPTGTCGGATYCNRPPTGCGTGYVSGSFNGQALCVKSSNTGTGSGTGTGTGDGGGSGTGTGDGGSGTGDGGGSGSGTPIDTGTGSTNINNSGSGSGSSTGGSGGGTTSTSFTIDLSPVVRAISALSDKLTWVKSELVNAVSRVEDKLTQTNSKLDTTNSKLDSVKSSVDQTTAAVNANATTVKTAVEANTAATNIVKSAVDANTNSTANKLNEVVNAINNKPIGGGGGGTTDVKPVVDAIEKQTTDFKDMMKTDSSDFDTSQYEKIGDASDDPRYLNAQSEATNALQNLSNKLTFSNTACVQDFTVDFPYFGSFVVPISRWCELLALIKILIHLSTLILAFRMLDSTVRAI
ncbi:hypothetical protein [Acinetobacter baumannii]|uniref:hypothetical protein n=1 Tax=Acinetobacter baumannii TaxID=470 RepID=UPI00259F010B|nr:hypothetical protein [Acinetobacter baumannii]ELW9312371.1 hypothetical protein [Acinetobacter baumannii]EMA4710724.1 hypothetical protein [Acinetobacter baumannii]EMD3988784.1 hypothetical protein [Acinetobacter baumannii]WPF11010.1 hypothetical protein PJS95_09640 [Acinetobacter baumannii]